MTTRNEIIRNLFEKLGKDGFFINELAKSWLKIGIYYKKPNASYIDFYIHNGESWEQIIKRMERHVSSLTDKYCVICNEIYNDNKKLMKLNCFRCGNAYCSDCYFTIMRNNFRLPKCPFCNQAVCDETDDRDLCSCEIEKIIILQCASSGFRYSPRVVS
jgi:hypothetical protein